MSVLIKGMKMPKSCCECGFNHCSQSRDDDTCLLLDKGISQLFVLVDRLPDCPLVEVPTPHGPLVDADALKATFCAECNHTITCEDCDIDYHIERLAPTIIEAEEGEPHEQN